ncbi:hypothetical protein EIP86_008026 [Pleurotus ostreatoroseus]|nr:hypothetical protein EIP86_008026 [Pleurotus ostreatoroseus]
MQPVTVQLEIYAQWRLWSGSYADNGKSSPSTINDPLDWRTYSDTTSFPTLKPDFTVFGVPRRSRKQRGWYQVKKRNASSPSFPLVYPRATGADVPPELFDRIIEAIAPNYLQDTRVEERQILAACGQVCRFWAEKCNKVLYYRLNLRKRDDFLTLRAFNEDSGSQIFRYWSDSDIHVSVTQLSSMPWLHLMTGLLQNAQKEGPAIGVTVEGPLPPKMKSMRTLHPGLPRAPRQFSYGITHLVLKDIHFQRLHDLMNVLRELPYLYWLECEKLTWAVLPSTIPRRLRSAGLQLQIPSYTMLLWKCSQTWGQALLFSLPCFIPHNTPWFSPEDLSRLLSLVQVLKMTTDELVCCATFSYSEGWNASGTVVLELSILEPGPSGRLVHRDPGYHAEKKITSLSIKAGSLINSSRLHDDPDQGELPIVHMNTLAIQIHDLHQAGSLYNWELLDNLLCAVTALSSVVFGFPSVSDMQSFVKDVVSTQLPLLSSRNLIRYAVDGLRTGEYAGWLRVSPDTDVKQRAGTTVLLNAY